MRKPRSAIWVGTAFNTAPHPARKLAGLPKGRQKTFAILFDRNML
jgi:hypothetical protein